MKKLLFNKLRTSALALLLIFSITFVPFPSNFDTNSTHTENITFSIHAATKNQKDCFSLKDVPKYNGKASVKINGNKPYFTEKEKTNLNTFESYHKLDKLGRCGVAYANVSKDTMPTEERGNIGNIKPSGWHTVKYKGVVDGNYLYNRCHLIAFCLTGENANKKNLITGTRYLNVEGMLPYEEKTAEYIEKTGNHVLYRVTPIFEGNNLLASGVLMEGYSVENQGKGISFCVYCYNIQPGIIIDYATGDSHLSDKSDNIKKNNIKTYILNSNTKKFHKPTCKSVKQMSAKNKKQCKCTRDELIKKGYSPCKNCNP